MFYVIDVGSGRELWGLDPVREGREARSRAQSTRWQALYCPPSAGSVSKVHPHYCMYVVHTNADNFNHVPPVVNVNTDELLNTCLKGSKC